MTEEVITTTEVQAEAPPPPPPPQDTSPPPPPPPPKPDYARLRQQERIDKLTAQKAALEAEVTKLKAGIGADEARIRAEVDELASRKARGMARGMAARQAFESALSNLTIEGQKEFGAEAFDKAVVSLRGIRDSNDEEQEQRYLAFLQGILSTGAGPKLVKMLGEDTNEASRLMALNSPVELGVELGKLASRDVQETSGAPTPIRPLSGAGRNHNPISAEDPERSDNLDMRVWMERRQAHVSEVNKKHGRRIIP